MDKENALKILTYDELLKNTLMEIYPKRNY